MNQDKKTEKIEMLQSHEALLQKRREQARARRNNETSEQRLIRLQRNRQRAAESRRRGQLQGPQFAATEKKTTENIVSRNVPKKQLPNENSACKLLKNTCVLKAESPVNRRLNYNTTVAHNCHGKYKSLTANTNRSRQIQIDHGKYKLLTANTNHSRQIQILL